MKPQILIVEDERNLAEAIQLNLELEGYATTLISNGQLAYNLLIESGRNFDLVLLDVMLPEKDGLTLCKNLRENKIHTPVLFLSSKNTSEDKIMGLKSGGDDYLGKPFNLEELLLRIKILLKRKIQDLEPDQQEATQANSVRIGLGEVNFKSYSIINKEGTELTLTKKEIDLLLLFTNKPNQVISRDDILEFIWRDKQASARTIDNLILNFRKYFEADPKEPKHFLTIRGVGYKYLA
ncbi:MAG: response regulator transcription factor [Flavobacteriales bacterium]|nr:response regulator transcription factor [Flavobacteriales bacterium]